MTLWLCLFIIRWATLQDLREIGLTALKRGGGPPMGHPDPHFGGPEYTHPTPTTHPPHPYLTPTSHLPPFGEGMLLGRSFLCMLFKGKWLDLFLGCYPLP